MRCLDEQFDAWAAFARPCGAAARVLQAGERARTCRTGPAAADCRKQYGTRKLPPTVALGRCGLL
jgi:hypothetical protein